MNKKIITIILMITMILGAFTVTTSAASKSGGKYVKVKKATYQKYVKAYKQNATLKKQIKQKDATIKSLRSSLSEAQANAEDKDSMNSWVWMNINSMGINYENKTWTIPADMPEKFIINGTTYYVVKEGE